jgi:hypothetical protein
MCRRNDTVANDKAAAVPDSDNRRRLLGEVWSRVAAYFNFVHFAYPFIAYA